MSTALAEAQRAEFMLKLRQRYRELWADIRREISRGDLETYQDTAGETHDLGDEATADLVTDINLADIHRDVVEIREVEAAIQRLMEGNYGVCADCGKNIDPARLRANPAALRCEHCQERYEQLHMPAVGPSL
ncbi:TraR/DksA family transcriptional regulator [Solimonas flava]|uniref:TraR/DksA family transcriptional regulator n=1 Tax=Solimonas flava TaxID=415849 RepID=UPI0003F9407C|nr:TraR/DksA family transcriptional regulator [Solimonas flava]